MQNLVVVSHSVCVHADGTKNFRDAGALHQWCLHMLLGVKWYHFISNDEVRRQTNQPLFTEIIQARRLNLFRPIRCKCHVRLWRWLSADAHYGLDKFSEFRWCSISLHAVDIQSMNVFLCLPLARLPSIIPVNATASNWFFLITWPTNRICLLKITFRRFLDVLALWSTWSLDTLSVHDIRNIRRKKHTGAALP